MIYFIQIYLSLLEICKECLMRERTKHPYKICKILVGRKITSSLMMYKCWFVVVVFYNILSFMGK